jgi:iron complex transport system substrate-binding protein
MRRRGLLLAPLLVPSLARAAAGSARILTLGGAVTETVFALGCGDRLVGTDLTSRYPAAAAALPKTGYLRALGAEGVLSLRPDLILASADAGPPAALRQIAAGGVRIVTLEEAHTPDTALDRIAAIATALDRDAAPLLARMRGDLAQLRADIAALRVRPRVMFLLSAGRGAPLAAGAGTAAEGMIHLAGASNAIAGTSYRPVSAEAVLLAAPDIIVTTDDTLAGVGGVAGLLALPGMAATSAGRAGRVAAFDALYLLGFGPRLAPALRDLALAVHPGAGLRPLAAG